MYSFKAIGTTERKSVSSFLNDSPVKRNNYICTGVFHCEYLHEEIKQLSHTEVTTPLLQTIRRIRLESTGSEESDANGYNIFLIYS
jgi:hypothetical protein